MNLQSFFWQVFFAIALMCFSSIVLFNELARVMNEPKWAIFICLIPVTAVALFMAYRLSLPLDSLRHHLKKMAEGDISDRLKKLTTEVVEIHELASAVETIRDQLQQRIHTISTQKSEQDALLASMVEGVVAVDHKKDILHLNHSAGLILNVMPEEVIGLNLSEVIKESTILDTLEESLSKNEMLERDVEIEGNDKVYLQLHVSPMRLQNDFRYGAVLVFSDVTRLRALENMRRDFVSNVSHELRTPLTSIQGFAETLLNPAVKDPKEIQNFLQIIQRHASRLGRIIEDILTLSRIERDAESSQIELKEDHILPVLQSTVELCQNKAAKKNIQLEYTCDAELKAMIDPYLLEQAVINLVDNAIRYSEDSRTIKIKAEQVENEVLISVQDQGGGISKELIPRIFERFYRIDKARSRELGGTGLGLSIVKHIAIAHKGRVEVQSEIGEGSTFTIYMPAQNG
ncbi:MAG: PAS domain-containing protein [Bdellovibrionales bacterium]|nr:PAS domain-containing protein [Bdellovibrionales bacterium]